jgi:prepilin-type N-terminal cleavage/methylation domain-containing protein
MKKIFLNKNIVKQSRGFTLVEMLVSLAVFMIVMTVAVGSLVSIINANKKAQAIKNVINNVNLAVESISRDMRTGSEYGCHIKNQGFKGNCSGGGDAIMYKNSAGKMVYYRYEPTENIISTSSIGNIQRCTADICDIISDTNWQSITAPVSNVNITNMVFYVFGTSEPTIQPHAIITMEGIAGVDNNTKTDFTLQTTISQRARKTN